MHSFIHCSSFTCWIRIKALSSKEEDLQHYEHCIDKEGGGSIIALLHRNRVHLTLSILTQMCSLSYITYQCHFAIYVRDPSLRNNTYPFKPYLQELFSLALMSLQAKPSLKSLREIAPPVLLLSFLPLVANNLNQISATNHQQGCQPICILSKC